MFDSDRFAQLSSDVLVQENASEGENEALRKVMMEFEVELLKLLSLLPRRQPTP